MKRSCFKGCFCSKAGFTLIELLVVVLIIGILAAVALPQYQKAVLKTRMVSAITACDALFKAAKIYRLANGKWPTKLDELDVEMPGTLNDGKWEILGTNFRCDYTSSSPSIMCYIMINQNAVNLGVRHFFDGNGKRFCFAAANNTQYNDICKTVGSPTASSISNSDIKYYLIP